jgi:hypothetical protein
VYLLDFWIRMVGAVSGFHEWDRDTAGFGYPSPKNTLPAVLYAFDANNVGIELWDSSQALNQRD